MTLVTISLAPVLIILIYIYFRDKYEKEPIGLLLLGLIAGALITIPIVLIEWLLSRPTNVLPGIYNAGYQSFIIAGLTEEFFKFTAVMLLFWRNREFDERFDGIVYAVFVSLGFAAVENLMYVFDSGVETGIIRALTAVPAHAVFGITMGYYIGLAKFMPEQKRGFLIKAMLYPLILHGLYDYLLLSNDTFLLLLFIPYVIYLWRSGSKKMKKLTIQPSGDN